MELTNEAINDIAQSLDMGMVCYINKETKEYKFIPKPDQVDDFDELWQAEMDIVEKWKQYIALEKMDSTKSFRIMEDFADQLPDGQMKKRLFNALNKSRPFRNFKDALLYDEDIREQWFAFEMARIESWVMRQLAYED